MDSLGLAWTQNPWMPPQVESKGKDRKCVARLLLKATSKAALKNPTERKGLPRMP